MTDQEVLALINHLVEEEHELIKKEERGELAANNRERMESLQVALDQCWDLLRQRRARRNAGLDADTATVRDATIVEHFKQ